MSIYCSLRKADIPPIGCHIFDSNYCQLEMKCPFIREVPEANSEQKYKNIQKLEQKLDKSENEF